MTSNRSKPLQVLKKVTTCNKWGALGDWQNECPQKGHRQSSSPSDRSSGSGRVRKQSCSRKRSPNGQGKGKGKSRRVKFEEAFPIQEVYRGDPEERKSHMILPPGWAVLDCGVAKSLAGAESAAMSAQALRNTFAKQETIARSRLWNRIAIFVESENK